MSILYNTVIQLTSSVPVLSAIDRSRTLNDFAENFGWTPSDILDIPSTREFANAHLIVEHGLEIQAVITFLQRRYTDLNYEEKKRLLNVSYNNLVDWHIQIEQEQILYIFNRSDPERIVESHRISRDNLDSLRSRAFEQVSGKRQNPNIPALDNALINTISFWKRNLYSEMGSCITNRELSALFNAIIFTRAVEDNYCRLSTKNDANSQFLFESVIRTNDNTLTIRQAILATLNHFNQSNIPQYLIDESLLTVFDTLNNQTVVALFKDFYRIKYAKPYEYDFSLISKHALSRIYERYTSILRIEETQQLSLFPILPEEEPNKTYGSFYTPHFIARFFARYLREQMPPTMFQRLRTLEPSIGSGIFLRTLLEMQCDLTQGRVTTELIKTAFRNIVGLDIDPNACQAALLSLSLLHLVLTNELPLELSIYTEESIKYYQEHPELRESFDAVIANPPYIALTNQSDAMRQRVAEFMDTDASGKIDLYLAFLKISLEVLKPGGYGLFVIPHSFLLAKNSAGMRKLLAQDTWIRCLVDLSDVQVFEGVDSYVILLIYQKRFNLKPAPLATIAQCKELVGRALQDVVEGNQTETKFYNIFNVSQETFLADEWVLLPPSLSVIQRKLETLPQLSDFMQVRVGLQTGNNKVFIIPESNIPKNEKKIFIPFLSDREMESYSVPEKVNSYLFYPYIDGQKLEENNIKNNFPKTWNYLLKHKEKLETRASVRKHQILWWDLERSRFEYLRQPKILSPHLAIMPRFSLDHDGKYAVVRSPIIYPKNQEIEHDLLRYFIAILNSTVCYQYIAEHSPKYGSGYSMLEPKSLLKTPIPDPTKVSASAMHRLLLLVDKRLIASGQEIINIEMEIDNLVADLYGFNNQERSIYGILT